MSAHFIPKAFIQELLSRIDIVEIINQHVTLRKRGQSYLACCPFHQEKTPSFNVAQKKQYYHCFGCHSSGDAIAFVMNYERLNFVEAVEKLAHKVGMQIPKEAVDVTVQSEKNNHIKLMNQIVQWFQQQLTRNQTALDYLKQRGISAPIASYQLGYAPAGWDNLLTQFANHKDALVATGMVIKRDQGGYYDRFRNRIMFPILNRRGDCVGFGGRVLDNSEPKYLNSPETSLFQKSYELYGLYYVLKNYRDVADIIIVEGYMDVLALVQHDCPRVVATLGTATTQQHLEILYRYTKRIIFCFDGDKAGRVAAWRALQQCCKVLQDGRDARFIFLPEGDDPDTYIQRFGLAAWQKIVAESLSVEQFLFSYLRGSGLTQTLEGRAKFAQQAYPIIATVPSFTLQELLLDELAKITRIDAERVKHLAGFDKKNSMPSAQASKTRYQPALKQAQRATAILLQYPELIQYIKHTYWIQDLADPGADLLLFLVEILQEQTFVNTAQILAYCQGQPKYTQLEQLAHYPILCPEAGITAEFTDIVLGLRNQAIDTQIAQLMRAAAEQRISQSEKALLQNLLRKRKTNKNNMLEEEW